MSLAIWLVRRARSTSKSIRPSSGTASRASFVTAFAEAMADGKLPTPAMPKIIGGRFAPTPVAGEVRPFMAEAWQLKEVRHVVYGDDLAISGFV